MFLGKGSTTETLTAEDVQKATEARLIVSSGLKVMEW